jgi:hypothetical protein
MWLRMHIEMESYNILGCSESNLRYNEKQKLLCTKKSMCILKLLLNIETLVLLGNTFLYVFVKQARRLWA